MDFVQALQRLLSIMETQYGEKPTEIIVSDSLLNKIILSRTPDLRFKNTNKNRTVSFSYCHGNTEIKFKTKEK